MSDKKAILTPDDEPILQSDLTDQEWQTIEPLLPGQNLLVKRRVDKRRCWMQFSPCRQRHQMACLPVIFQHSKQCMDTID